MSEKHYPDGQIIKVGDVVCKNSQGRFGPETFRVMLTQVPESPFIRIAIVVNDKPNITEDVPTEYLRLVTRI